MGIELVKRSGSLSLTKPVTSESVDLSNYYTKAQTDGKIQEAINAIPQADWQQNDETANDYVKNRPGGYDGLPENIRVKKRSFSK